MPVLQTACLYYKLHQLDYSPRKTSVYIRHCAKLLHFIYNYAHKVKPAYYRVYDHITCGLTA